MSRAKIISILLVLFSVSFCLGQADSENAPRTIASEPVNTEESVASEEFYTPSPARRPSFPLHTFFLMLLLSLPPAIVCNVLAGQKGKGRALWTVVGIIPFIGFYGILYLIGSRDEILSSKLDDVLTLLSKEREKD